MTLNGITLDRLADRRTLLDRFDRMRRDVDASGVMEGMDAFNQQALGVLTSSKLVEALDYQKEKPEAIERYGKGDPKVHGDAAPMMNEQFLVARRLVEAGARVVTLAYGFWDYHGNNFGNARSDLPMLDQALSALVQDLHDRGLLETTLVVATGEFGRTPKINKDAGRDHWAGVYTVVLAGGGIQGGRVHGASDAQAAYPQSDAVGPWDIAATIFHCVGLSPDAEIMDHGNRPMKITRGEPIHTLL